jgi:hypothetical protein
VVEVVLVLLVGMAHLMERMVLEEMEGMELHQLFLDQA